MTARTVNNLPAATHDEAVRCLLAMDLSKGNWVIAVNTPLSDKISRHTLRGPDKWKELVDLIERTRRRVGQGLGRPVEFVSCYEAGYDGFWLHRKLEAYGVRNYVIDPASVRVDRRARRAKTDGIDSEGLLRSLMAYLRGEPKVWQVVRVPSIAEEDARRLSRERKRLIKERDGHTNRIKGLCAVHGIYRYAPERGDRRARLEQLRTAQGAPLPAGAKAELRRQVQRLELVLELLATIEAERDAVVSDTASTHVNAKKIQDLHKLRSIGPEFATQLVNEVYYRGFDNRRQLGSYVGLTPSPFQSGDMARDQGISKAGNPRARTVMVELAWLWLRYQPGSALSIWFHKRVGGLKGRIKRITIVAMARKLLVALWRYLETGVVPEGAVLKA
jgi:transposase